MGLLIGRAARRRCFAVAAQEWLWHENVHSAQMMKPLSPSVCAHLQVWMDGLVVKVGLQCPVNMCDDIRGHVSTARGGSCIQRIT